MLDSTITATLPYWEEKDLAVICGIANAGGGTIVISADPSAGHRSMRRLRRIFETIPALSQRELGVTCATEPVMDGMQLSLEITVHPAEDPVSYEGNYYLYTHGTNRVISAEEVERLQQRNAEAAWEGRLQPFVRDDDIDPDILSAVFEKADEHMDHHDNREAAVKHLLQEFGMKSRQLDAFTNVGVMLMHRAPDLHIPGAFIKINLFDAMGVSRSMTDVASGPLTMQLTRAMELLYERYLPAAFAMTESRSGTNPLALPQRAVHEALLNALVHKDYDSKMPIEVSVHPTKVYIDNVGRPPVGWTQDDLLKRHNSRPFNPRLALALQRHHVFNGWGTGIGIMVDACRDAGLPDPVITLRADEMDVCFRFGKASEGSDASKQSTGASSAAMSTGASTESPTTPFAGPAHSPREATERKPTFKERSIAAANRLDMTSTDEYILKVIETNGRVTALRIAEVLGVSESTVRRSFRRLREYGFIERIGSDKAGYWRLTD